MKKTELSVFDDKWLQCFFRETYETSLNGGVGFCWKMASSENGKSWVPFLPFCTGMEFFFLNGNAWSQGNESDTVGCGIAWRSRLCCFRARSRTGCSAAGNLV